MVSAAIFLILKQSLRPFIGSILKVTGHHTQLNRWLKKLSGTSYLLKQNDLQN
jgi:hypothetical protein